MAGRKRTPTHLRIVTGNPGHRPLPKGEPMPIGAPEKPAYLTGRAAELWSEVITRCWWLRWPDAHKAGLWCVLQSRFEAAPDAMVAAMITQLRVTASELGLDPVGRAKLNANGESAGKDEAFLTRRKAP